MSEEEIEKVKEKIQEYIQTEISGTDLKIMYFLITNIVTESSIVLCAGKNASSLIAQAFNVKVEGDCADLEGVVSRKKQFFPAIVEALQQ
jgi:manganese-dependent inorganic pyrophosphatase